MGWTRALLVLVIAGCGSSSEGDGTTPPGGDGNGGEQTDTNVTPADPNRPQGDLAQPGPEGPPTPPPAEQVNGCALQIAEEQEAEAVLAPGNDPIVEGVPALNEDGSLMALLLSVPARDGAPRQPVSVEIYRISNGRRVRGFTVASAEELNQLNGEDTRQSERASTAIEGHVENTNRFLRTQSFTGLRAITGIRTAQNPDQVIDGFVGMETECRERFGIDPALRLEVETEPMAGEYPTATNPQCPPTVQDAAVFVSPAEKRVAFRLAVGAIGEGCPPIATVHVLGRYVAE